MGLCLPGDTGLEKNQIWWIDSYVSHARFVYVCLYVWLYVFLAVWPTYLILTCVAPTLACLTRMARSPRCHTTIFVCCRSAFANRFLTLGRVCKYNMCPPTLTCLLCSSPSCWPQQAMWWWPDQSNDDLVCFGASEQKSETTGSGQENRLFLHCRSSLELAHQIRQGINYE